MTSVRFLTDDVIEAVISRIRAGPRWRELLADFPSCQTVWYRLDRCVDGRTPPATWSEWRRRTSPSPGLLNTRFTATELQRDVAARFQRHARSLRHRAEDALRAFTASRHAPRQVTNDSGAEDGRSNPKEHDREGPCRRQITSGRGAAGEHRLACTVSPSSLRLSRVWCVTRA